jgi:hypothetical protein
MTGIATSGVVMDLIRTMKVHIRVKTSIQEHKTGPFNTKVDVTMKFVPDRCE